jgi:hypothetical protein
MTKKSRSLTAHISLICALLIVGVGATAINYYRISNSGTKLAIKEGLNGRFLTIKPLSNGLAKVSVVDINQPQAPQPVVINPLVNDLSLNLGSSTLNNLNY